MYDELVKRLRTATTLPVMNALCQEAADAIEELQQIAGHYEESAHDYFKDVCYYLERVPKWIPVTERLPNGEAERYLVAYPLMSLGLRVSICYYADNLEEVDEYDFKDEKHSGFYWYDGEYGYCEQRDVKYWMPLPQPPKESEP